MKKRLAHVPCVIITEGAVQSLECCRQFLAERNPLAAKRAAQAFERQFAILESNSDIGRPLDDFSGLRELVVGFGGSGYVALYHRETEISTAYVLAFRHQKEAGY